MATILIVEDESPIARRMVSLMRNAGHTPVLAPGGHAALRAVELRPHVIVLDFGVRNGQGEELLERLVRTPEAAHAPVVIVTGDIESVARLSASKPPWLADIVMKPIDGQRLSRAVQTALARNGNGAGSGRQPDAVDGSGTGRSRHVFAIAQAETEFQHAGDSESRCGDRLTRHFIIE